MPTSASGLAHIGAGTCALFDRRPPHRTANTLYGTLGTPCTSTAPVLRVLYTIEVYSLGCPAYRKSYSQPGARAVPRHAHAHRSRRAPSSTSTCTRARRRCSSARRPRFCCSRSSRRRSAPAMPCHAAHAYMCTFTHAGWTEGPDSAPMCPLLVAMWGWAVHWAARWPLHGDSVRGDVCE